MNVKITLDNFNADHNETAIFNIFMLDQEGDLGGTVGLDFSNPVHKVRMDFYHPFMTVLAQSHVLRCCVDMLDTHFAEETTPQNEWSGNIYDYI